MCSIHPNVHQNVIFMIVFVFSNCVKWGWGVGGSAEVAFVSAGTCVEEYVGHLQVMEGD